MRESYAINNHSMSLPLSFDFYNSIIEVPSPDIALALQYLINQIRDIEDELNPGLNYDKIADDLGFRRFDFWLWDKRAKIYIYDDVRSYQAATNQPSWSSGCAIIKDKIIPRGIGILK